MRQQRRGFALLITITLLAFLVLLLVSLASLTRVETQVAGNNQSISQARQNALMALNIALGQLQRATGPDQRVTASADLQPLASGSTTDTASGVSLVASGATAANRITATQTALSQIDAYWKDSRNRRWIGAWRATDSNLASFNADNPSAANTAPVLVNWLVSGNETVPATFAPGARISGLTLAAVTAADSGATPLFDASGNAYQLLVGARTAGIETAADLDRAVLAPRVEIHSSSVQGLSGAQTVGHYAWWIGDEGLKARANLSDAYAGDSSDHAARIRLQSPQRPVLEAMTLAGPASGSDDDKGLAPFEDILANNPDLGKVLSHAQLHGLDNTPAYRAQLDKRWHDLSYVSRGVLSDTRHGGLKHDLSFLLSRPDLGSLRAALPSGFAPNPTYNRLLSTVATPYATQPPALIASNGPFGATVSSGMDMFAYSATWEQLWSYYNLGNAIAPPAGVPAGSFVTSEEVRPRVNTATAQGVHPVLVQVKLFYKLRIAGGVVDPDDVNRSGNIWVDIIPVAVLANPYNIALEAQNYILRSTGGDMGRVRLYYGLNPDDPEDPQDTEFPFPVGSPKVYPPTSLSLPNGALGEVKFTLKAPRMEPGRAYVFTLETASTTIPSATAAQRNLVVNMVNDFHQTHALTRDTGRTIAAAPATHAALVSDNGMAAFKLHSSDYTDVLGDRTLLRAIVPHTYAADSAADTILVYPFSSDLRHGGGLGVFIHDASNIAASQQTTAYQVNYRGLIVDNAAYTSFGTNPNGTGQRDIAITFARTRVKNGSSSFAGNDTPNEFLQSHLLWRDASDPREVRWGVFNTGDGYDGTVVPPALSGDAGLVNILYDVPRAANPPSAISQLRHFNTAGHIPFQRWDASGGGNATADKFSIVNHSFQPNYPIGNSYPNPFIIRQKVIDGDGGMGFQYDGSYLWNDALMDRFHFSTYPQTGDFDFADPADRLVNNRNRPFRDRATAPWDDPARFRSDSRSAAQNLLVEGAFNINSTSIDAWKALLSSVRDIPVGGETTPANLTAPFARTLYQPGASADSRAGGTENAWTGTINFSTSEIDALSREIVLQIRRRGPFVSLADFANRRLVASAADTLGLGLSGALQSAIDRILNQKADVQPAALQTSSNNRSGGNQRIAEDAFILPSAVSGSSGYILQSDILSAIEPVLSARSDTFIIRTYGDTRNPVTGDTIGRAWCEAVVQRTPDYIDSTSAAAMPVAGTPAANFGRRYQIVSFRWLSPEDI